MIDKERINPRNEGVKQPQPTQALLSNELKKQQMKNKILRLPSVIAWTGLSRSTIYLRISEGKFPQPISLGPRTVGWIEADIANWLEQKISESRLITTEKKIYK